MYSVQQPSYNSHDGVLAKIEDSPRRVMDFKCESSNFSVTSPELPPIERPSFTKPRGHKSLKMQEEVLKQVASRVEKMLERGDSTELSWLEVEDRLLEVAVDEMGSFSNPPWLDISEQYFQGIRSPSECEERWDDYVSPVNFHLVMVGGKPVMRRSSKVKIQHDVESSSSASGDSDGCFIFDLFFWGKK